jgi:RNA polymerase sigma factor (TIGR02999 family)
MASGSSPVTELLLRWKGGDQDALQKLLPLVYDELRRIARYHLQGERSDHTLQSTALVHEAYLRLLDQQPLQVQSRAHFVAVSSRLMREILVDHARKRGAAKRGSGYKLTIDKALAIAEEPDYDLLALDDALQELARMDPQQAQIVELRFFGGLTIEEISSVLGISPATIKRDWTTARAWLHRELARKAESKT